LKGPWLFALPLAPRSDEPELERRHKRDPQKIKIALCLRLETTMTLTLGCEPLEGGRQDSDGAPAIVARSGKGKLRNQDMKGFTMLRTDRFMIEGISAALFSDEALGG